MDQSFGQNVGHHLELTQSTLTNRLDPMDWMDRHIVGRHRSSISSSILCDWRSILPKTRLEISELCCVVRVVCGPEAALLK